MNQLLMVILVLVLWLIYVEVVAYSCGSTSLHKSCSLVTFWGWLTGRTCLLNKHCLKLHPLIPQNHFLMDSWHKMSIEILQVPRLWHYGLMVYQHVTSRTWTRWIFLAVQVRDIWPLTLRMRNMWSPPWRRGQPLALPVFDALKVGNWWF